MNSERPKKAIETQLEQKPVTLSHKSDQSSAERESDLSNPAKVLQRSGAAPSSYVVQIELALEKLESYSLRSSEDINDSIE